MYHRFLEIDRWTSWPASIRWASSSRVKCWWLTWRIQIGSQSCHLAACHGAPGRSMRFLIEIWCLNKNPVKEEGWCHHHQPRWPYLPRRHHCARVGHPGHRGMWRCHRQGEERPGSTVDETTNHWGIWGLDTFEVGIWPKNVGKFSHKIGFDHQEVGFDHERIGVLTSESCGFDQQNGWNTKIQPTRWIWHKMDIGPANMLISPTKSGRLNRLHIDRDAGLKHENGLDWWT